MPIPPERGAIPQDLKAALGPGAERLGAEVKKLREARGLTKAELARRAGISEPYLLQIEAGQRRPTEAKVRHLAGALDVPNIKLLEAAGFVDRRDRLLVKEYNADPHMLESLPDIVRLLGSGPAAPKGPEGWDELSQTDQRLVQQLVNRLRFIDTTDE